MRDADGRTALHHAVTTPSMVLALLQAGADRYLLDKEQRTPMMTAHAKDLSETIDEFHNASNALQYHRPPLRALANEV